MNRTEYFQKLLEERDTTDIDVPSLETLTDYEVGKWIGKLKKQPPKPGSKTEKEWNSIAAITDGDYTLSARSAATVKNYKSERYFPEPGAVKVTVRKGWVNVVKSDGNTYPIRDRVARRAVLLKVAAQ